MKKTLVWILVLITSTSCGLFEHRDFESEMNFDQFNGPMFEPGRDFDTVSGDTGRSYYSDPQVIKRRIPATEYERESNSYQQSLQRELYYLENSLSDAEYSDYLKVRESFSNNSERIYYLGLSPANRVDYLAAKGLNLGQSYSSSTPSRRPAAVARPAMPSYESSFYEASDKGITLGMSKEEVANILGTPERLEVAGNPAYENERWTYTRHGVIRQIYFENGSVGGWTQKD